VIGFSFKVCARSKTGGFAPPRNSLKNIGAR
jgi:hypothetical protein